MLRLIFAGLRYLVSLLFMCIGSRTWLLAISGLSLVGMLHSFLSLASRPICLRPAFEFGGLSCVVVVVSCHGDCIGHILVAMPWYSWMIVTTCVAAKSI